MTDKELRRLGRRELLELLMQQQQQNEKLRKRIAELEKTVSDRTIEIERTGSMAEAALMLSGVFQAADEAVARYKENIRRCSEDQKKAYDKIVFEAERRATQIIQAAEDEKKRRIAEADTYWYEIRQKITSYCNEHAELKELLGK